MYRKQCVCQYLQAVEYREYDRQPLRPVEEVGEAEHPRHSQDAQEREGPLDQGDDVLRLPVLGVDVALAVDVLLADGLARDEDGLGEHGRVDQDHQEDGRRERPDQTVLVVKPAAAKEKKNFISSTKNSLLKNVCSSNTTIKSPFTHRQQEAKYH